MPCQFGTRDTENSVSVSLTNAFPETNYADSIVSSDQEREILADHIKQLNSTLAEGQEILSKSHFTSPLDLHLIGIEFLDWVHDTDSVREKVMQLVRCESAVDDFTGQYMYYTLASKALQYTAFLFLYAHILSTCCKDEISIVPCSGVFERSGIKIQLSEDDYLHALITLVSELARLCPNLVSAALCDATKSVDFKVIVNLYSFVKQLQQGFLSLNLKNNILRRRVDGVKYDVKVIHVVICDLILKGYIDKSAIKLT
jgi:hypothetical protein